MIPGWVRESAVTLAIICLLVINWHLEIISKKMFETMQLTTELTILFYLNVLIIGFLGFFLGRQISLQPNFSKVKLIAHGVPAFVIAFTPPSVLLMSVWIPISVKAFLLNPSTRTLAAVWFGLTVSTMKTLSGKRQ
ncbi:MAG: hypothetical protein AB1510_11525 [Bacillota bacterium]